MFFPIFILGVIPPPVETVSIPPESEVEGGMAPDPNHG